METPSFETTQVGNHSMNIHTMCGFNLPVVSEED